MTGGSIAPEYSASAYVRHGSESRFDGSVLIILHPFTIALSPHARKTLNRDH